MKKNNFNSQKKKTLYQLFSNFFNLKIFKL